MLRISVVFFACCVAAVAPFSIGRVRADATAALAVHARVKNGGERSGGLTMTQEPLLVRSYKAQAVERTPVWLMRQAGRFMRSFRTISEKYSFRERSETPALAVELSLLPWQRFGVDGVIMFSDILTPLPALGVDFTIVEGAGPHIARPIRSADDIDRVGSLLDVDSQVPFIRPILETLRKEVTPETAVIGFVGAPWTLAAYSVEGGHSKLCKRFKSMCIEQPHLAQKLLDKYTDALCTYASHQVHCGAQVIQVFESWAHHLSQAQFERFAKPFARRLAAVFKERHPGVPLVYFSNGGSVFLEDQLDMGFDALSIDWRLSMAAARRVVGKEMVLAGNVDPCVLYGSDRTIELEVERTAKEAGDRFVLNLGHGVEKDMSEHAVDVFVKAGKALRKMAEPSG